jgi:hypothetical protein
MAMVLLFSSMIITDSVSAQTPMATAGATEERSYENTCDGAQAYFNDWHEAADVYGADGGTRSEVWKFPLAYFRASNPPPIVEEWTEANIVFWAAMSDFDLYMDWMPLLDAIDDASEELEDACEGIRIYQTD